MKDVPKIIQAIKHHVSYRKRKSNPFEVLIFTVLSQRTRDENTEKASQQLFSKFNTPSKLADAEIKEVERLIRPSGFFKVKARYVKAISKEIVRRFDGKVPNKLEDLLSLPGVGRKTANCTLVYGFNVPAIPVDTHCHRIPNRIGLIKTKTPEQSEFALMKVIPKKYWIKFNDLIVKFGQNVCLPINPKCGICKVAPYCDYYKKSIS
ncbi:MAG: endonuclease III [Candidatus Nanoarchaeia archaeon]